MSLVAVMTKLFSAKFLRRAKRIAKRVRMSDGEERSDEWKVDSYVCGWHVTFAVAPLQPSLVSPLSASPLHVRIGLVLCCGVVEGAATRPAGPSYVGYIIAPRENIRIFVPITVGEHPHDTPLR